METRLDVAAASVVVQRGEEEGRGAVVVKQRSSMFRRDATGCKKQLGRVLCCSARKWSPMTSWSREGDDVIAVAGVVEDELGVGAASRRARQGWRRHALLLARKRRRRCCRLMEGLEVA